MATSRRLPKPSASDFARSNRACLRLSQFHARQPSCFTPAHPRALCDSVAEPAAGGGPGMGWVNTTSKVYHCSGTRFYGTTKNGKYLFEAEAKVEGDRPDHGKPCPQ